MRVVNRNLEAIGYRLNLLGIRVYRHYAHLVARFGTEWVTIGPPRDLPIEVLRELREIGSNTLLLTAYQNTQENPCTDLYDVLNGRTNFDDALAED
jgi:hypothetical protein